MNNINDVIDELKKLWDNNNLEMTEQEFNYLIERLKQIIAQKDEEIKFLKETQRKFFENE